MLGRQYCIWYVDRSTNGQEIVAGVTATWSSAEALAKRLYTIRKRIDGMKDVSTGIFLFKDQELYTSRIPAKWQIMPIMTSNI